MATSTRGLPQPASPPLRDVGGGRGGGWRGWPGLLRSTQALIGLAIVGLFALAAVAAPWIAPTDPGLPVLAETLRGPSAAAPFGTDELGRNVFGRLVHGGRVSLRVAVLAVGVSLLVGAPLGLIAGYRGGAVDAVVMRAMDALLAFPAILLAVAIAAALGPGLTNAMIAIGVVGVPGYARVARAEVLRLQGGEFVQAARSAGATDARILARHILPNGLAPLIVATATGSAGAILTEASLSFVGLGAAPPTPSWGGMLQNGYPFADLAPWLSVFPGLAIALVTLGFTFLGDGLRDVFDPRLRGR